MSKKQRNRRIFIGFMIIVFIGITYPFWIWSYHIMTAPFTSPEMLSEIRKDYRKLSSDKLIAEIKGYCNPYSLDFSSPNPYAALRVLVERKEQKAVPTLISLMDCWIRGRRQIVIQALGVIGDERAIEPLMGVVRKGGDTREYLLALEALSKMHHDEIYPIILQMEKDDFHVSWVVDMLENFPEKPQTIPTLKKIARNHSRKYIREKAREALEVLQNM